MKKAILIASLLVSQVSFASSPTVANACLGKVQSLSNTLLNLVGAQASRDQFGVVEKESTLVGKNASGKSCTVNISSRAIPQSQSEQAYDLVTFSIQNASRTNHFSLETYRQELLTGIPGGPVEVDFNLHTCKVNESNLTAKVSYSQLGTKHSISITNKGDGILEFKVKEDGAGFLGLANLVVIGLQDDCTVDLKNQN